MIQAMVGLCDGGDNGSGGINAGGHIGLVTIMSDADCCDYHNGVVASYSAFTDDDKSNKKG